MLVLGRIVGDSIYIGNDIVVKVISIKGGVVNIGVKAPKSIKVHRYKHALEQQNENGFDINSK